jgi:hypothetical protein
MNDHSRAVFGESNRGGASNALRRAGDEYDFVFEFHVGFHFRKIVHEATLRFTKFFSSPS